MVEVLYAYMNGRFVGELRRESDGELSFILTRVAKTNGCVWKLRAPSVCPRQTRKF